MVLVSDAAVAYLNADRITGLWLREVSELLKEPTLVGTDIRPAFFPNIVTANLTLIQHDFTKPWPSYLHNYFDIVHQRYSLAAAVGASVEHVVKQLPILAKPGAWLQICETNRIGKDTDAPSVRDYHEVVNAMKSMGGGGADASVPGTVSKWLQEAGMEDVQEIMIDLPLGKACDDPDITEIGLDWIIRTVKLILGAVKRFGASVPGVDVDTLVQRFEKDAVESGVKLGLIISVGRKPDR